MAATAATVSATATATATAIESSTTEDAVQVMDEPQIPVIPFAVRLPTSTLQNFDDPSPKGNVMSLMGDNGIVGSIVLMKNSAMVWVSWGKLDLSGTPPSSSNGGGGFGKGIPTMGQMVVAMPRTNYKGAFGTGTKEASSSQIIGSTSSDDQMLASQMASRLSTRSDMAIFVSCQLSSGGGSGGGDDWSAGMDSETISHRAAALAEKEVWRILQEQKKKEEDAKTTTTTST